MSQGMTSESPQTDGLLTDELLGRAMNEIAEVQRELVDGTGEGAWLLDCEERLDNALRDIRTAHARFVKAAG